MKSFHPDRPRARAAASVRRDAARLPRMGGLALVAAGVLLAACNPFLSEERERAMALNIPLPPTQPPQPPSYCYKTLGVVDCHYGPLWDEEYRRVGPRVLPVASLSAEDLESLDGLVVNGVVLQNPSEGDLRRLDDQVLDGEDFVVPTADGPSAGFENEAPRVAPRADLRPPLMDLPPAEPAATTPVDALPLEATPPAPPAASQADPMEPTRLGPPAE